MRPGRLSVRSRQLVLLPVDHIPDRASKFVYCGNGSVQPVRARAFIDLAVTRLFDNREYVLGLKKLRLAPRSAAGSPIGRAQPRIA
jgi:hypothetical protein